MPPNTCICSMKIYWAPTVSGAYSYWELGSEQSKGPSLSSQSLHSSEGNKFSKCSREPVNNAEDLIYSGFNSELHVHLSCNQEIFYLK